MKGTWREEKSRPCQVPVFCQPGQHSGREAFLKNASRSKHGTKPTSGNNRAMEGEKLLPVSKVCAAAQAGREGGVEGLLRRFLGCRAATHTVLLSELAPRTVLNC